MKIVCFFPPHKSALTNETRTWLIKYAKDLHFLGGRSGCSGTQEGDKWLFFFIGEREDFVFCVCFLFILAYHLLTLNFFCLFCCLAAEYTLSWKTKKTVVKKDIILVRSTSLWSSSHFGTWSVKNRKEKTHKQGDFWPKSRLEGFFTEY